MLEKARPRSNFDKRFGAINSDILDNGYTEGAHSDSLTDRWCNESLLQVKLGLLFDGSKFVILRNLCKKLIENFAVLIAALSGVVKKEDPSFEINLFYQIF